MVHNEEKDFWTKSCRCKGEGFKVTQKELEEGIEFIYCSSCSLMSKVLYQEDENAAVLDKELYGKGFVLIFASFGFR